MFRHFRLAVLLPLTTLAVSGCNGITEVDELQYIKETDEVDYYLFRTRELAQWMDMWEEEEKKQQYDKILMGYGGPVLAERFIKIQRMPFITPEILASPAHAMPMATTSP